MQKKIQPGSSGFATIFRKDALRFVLRWPEKMSVSMNWIGMIEIIAADPGVLRFHFRENFARAYAVRPDLAAALLNFLRGKWRALEKSNAGKLKRFISQEGVVKWQRGFGAKPDSLGYVPLCELQDGEVAKAFESSPGGYVLKIANVVKARQWVAKNQIKGKKFEAKYADANGHVHIKGRVRSRK